MTDDLITVFTTNADWEAELVKHELAEEGIAVHLSYESVRHVYGLFADGLGQIRVQVLAAEADTAKRIVENYAQRQAAPDTDETPENDPT